jgi:hypothetical protein
MEKISGNIENAWWNHLTYDEQVYWLERKWPNLIPQMRASSLLLFAMHRNACKNPQDLFEMFIKETEK